MSFIIVCPSCGLRGHIPESIDTPSLRCPRCGSQVPNPSVAPAPAPVRGQPQGGHLLDEFFARAYDGVAVATPVPPAVAVPPQPAGLPPLPEPAPPAPLPPVERPPQANGSVADPRAEEEWIREERQRLEAYMGKHFALLQQQREEFSSWRTQVEAALVGREQELNRQQKVLTTHAEGLNQRSNALADQEGILAQQAERVRQAGEQVQQQLAAEHAALAQARQDTEKARHEMTRVRQELTTLHAEAAKHRAAWEAERLDQLHRAADREKRQVKLVKAEESLQRRVAEVKGLEAQIYQELERQEQRLGLERRAIEKLRFELALKEEEREALRRKIGTLSQELEKLRRQAQPQRPPAPPAR